VQFDGNPDLSGSKCGGLNPKPCLPSEILQRKPQRGFHQGTSEPFLELCFCP
jgi:hypothetical protein